MKHVFTIHSPITFLCAVSVCKHLDLPEKDVILISSGYKAPFEYGSIVNSFQDDNKGLLAKLRRWIVPLSYDRYIDKITEKKPFVAYIDLMHYWQRLLVTHPQCSSFNFIEEGTASYIKPDNLNELTRLKNKTGFRINRLSEYFNLLYFSLRSYNHRLVNLPYWPFSYRYIESVSYYGFSEHCYPGVFDDKRVIVPFYGAKKNKTTLYNAIVWVEESFNKKDVPEKKNINDAIEKALVFIQENYGNTHNHYIKLRPSQEKHDSEVIPILHNFDIKYQLIDNRYPLELTLSKSKNIVVVGSVSSLLFYSRIMGHEAYSYIMLLKNRKISVFDKMEYYWRLVDKIDDKL